MAKAKPPFIPDPRAWSTYQVACRFGRSESWFKEHRGALEAAGFPRSDALLGGWDGCAIELWFDMRSGINRASSQTSNDLELMGEIYE